MRATTRLACEIARVNPDRLNESIHSGAYDCAPPTKPGAARVFDQDDIVALMIYGLISNSVGKHATPGEWACMVRRQMQMTPQAETVSICFNQYGHAYVAEGSPQSIEEAANTLAWFTFNIADLRRRVRARLEDEDQNRVVG